MSSPVEARGLGNFFDDQLYCLEPLLSLFVVTVSNTDEMSAIFGK